MPFAGPETALVATISVHMDLIRIREENLRPAAR
jgi:hypothetical protein